MLRPDMLLALSLTSALINTLSLTYFAIRSYSSYAGAWPFPQPDFSGLEETYLVGHVEH